MKKTAVVSIALSVLLAGCLAGNSGDVDLDPNSKDGKDVLDQLVITAEAQGDGAYAFSVPELPGLSYTWDFGDLTTAEGASVAHQYMVENGQMSVVLEARDNAGNTVHVGKAITLGTGQNSNPTAAFTFDGPYVGVGAPFTVDASGTSDPDGDALKVSWYLAAASEKPAGDDSGDDGHAGHEHLLTSQNGAMGHQEEGHEGHGSGGDGHDHAHGGGLDTGNVLPGEAAELKYDLVGTYQMHCHPHPWMVGQVKVVPGAATEATVTMVESAYWPSVVEVAPGGTVTYVNAEAGDTMFHTSTQSAFAPGGEKLALGDLTGELTIDTEGTYDLVLVVEDGKGQLGVAKKRIIVTSDVPSDTFEASYEGTYAGATVTSAEAGQTNARAHPFEIEFPGHAMISTSVEGNGNLVFRLLDDGGNELARGENMEAMLEAGAYKIEVTPADAVMVETSYTVDVLVHLDLSQGEKSDDGHGGHHH